jgi:NNP family nitrate/nitrite transporter-like MFS transporter
MPCVPTPQGVPSPHPNQAKAEGADIARLAPGRRRLLECGTGKKVAYRNLWISVPALLCGFAVWGMWGIITVQMLNLGFPFTQAELFTLTAIAGISGATMRIPASFLIRLAGGRNTIFLTTAMLLAPAIGTGIVLQHQDWPLWAFQLMALWSGVGGGNFASSMSNISTFFPKRLQGTALGPERGPGQLRRDDDADRHPAGDDGGPVRRLWGRADGAGQGQRLDLREDRRGHAHLGAERRLRLGAVAGAAEHPVLVGHEQPQDGVAPVGTPAGSPLVAFAKITYLYTLAFVPAIFMLYLYLPRPTGLGVLSMWVAIPLDVMLALLA